jgi:uroporphyrinogen-III synthase
VSRSSADKPTADKPRAGWRVLVPRGGDWGARFAAELRSEGATPTVAPLINFAPASDHGSLTDAFERLRAGEFGWLVVTSATTGDGLSAMQGAVPSTTRIAAVGETTASALRVAGYRVDFVPTNESSALGLVNELPLGAAPEHLLVPQSEIAETTLIEGLRRLGHEVRPVTAYRTIGVTAPDAVVEDVRAGRFRAILVTSGSVAREVARQFGEIPEVTFIACIGPRTAHDALAAGLPVDIIARERSRLSLIAAMVEFRRELQPTEGR